MTKGLEAITVYTLPPIKRRIDKLSKRLSLDNASSLSRIGQQLVLCLDDKTLRDLLEIDTELVKIAKANR